MAKKLIVNADGFGFTPGVNRGILETIEHGIVSSTSCVVNFPYIDELPVLARRFPKVSVGVHLNLSVGRPVSQVGQVPTLVNPQGEFFGDEFVRQLMLGRIASRDIETELTAQIRRVLDLGVTPSHWDGHQNKHLYPRFFSTAIHVAKRHGITRVRTHHRYLFLEDGKDRSRVIRTYYLHNPLRLLTHGAGRVRAWQARHNGLRTADRLISPGYADHTAKKLTATWVALMRLMPEGTNEVYCHPGYPDDVLRANARYVDERRQEIEVLNSDEVRSAGQESGVEIISFHEL